MFLQTTLGTDKRSLRGSARGIDMSAPVASLRGVRCGNLSEYASAPSKLVAEHLGKPSPTRAQNPSGKARVGLDHVADLQLLDDDGAVALGVVVRDLMQSVFALPSHFSMENGDASLCLLPVLRPFLSSSDSPLGSGKPLQSPLQVRRVFDRPAVRVGGQQHDASIDRNDRNGAGDGIGDLGLAEDRSEPLIAVPSDCAGLWSSFEGSVNDCPHLPELRKVETIADEIPSLRMRLAETDGVSAFPLPARSASEFLEAALPTLVEFDEKLSRDVSRNSGEPGKLSSKSGQLVDLIECSRVSPVVFRSAKTCLSLFESDVPEESESALPSEKFLDLLGARIDPKSKPLANDHASSYKLVCDEVNRVSHRTTCGFRFDGPLGLRDQVPSRSFDAEGLRRPQGVVGDRLQGLRMRAEGGRLRGRPRPSPCRVPSEGVIVDARRLPQGRLSAKDQERGIPGGREKALGLALLEPQLLRCLLRRRSPRDCKTIRPSTTRRASLLLALKGEVSAMEIR